MHTADTATQALRLANLTAALTSIAGNPEPPAHRVWLDATAAKCRAALADVTPAGKTKPRKRAWMRMTIEGDTHGRLIPVFPGVHGYAVGFGKTARLDGAGKLEQVPLTKIKVCARTLLSAVEQAQAMLGADA